MGNRYTLDLNCVYCDKLNKEVWYAPTCAADTFVCEHCDKPNFITEDTKAIKWEDVTFEDIKEGFVNNTNVGWKDEELENMCKQRLLQIQNKEK